MAITLALIGVRFYRTDGRPSPLRLGVAHNEIGETEIRIGGWIEYSCEEQYQEKEGKHDREL